MKNLVCISNLNNIITSTYSLRSWELWCSKHNIELLVLDQNITNNPEIDKFFIFDLLDNENINYNQILLTNNLTIVNPNTPNIFNITDNKISGVMYDSSYKEIINSIQGYSNQYFENFMFPYWEFINTTLLVINNSHKDLFTEIKNFYLNNNQGHNLYSNVDLSHVYFNFLKYKNNTKFKILPYEWNMHDMVRKESLNNLLFTEIGWVYNFDFLPQYRQQLMEQTFKKIYK